MSSILSDLPEIIADAAGDLFFDAVLTRSVDSAGPNNWTPGTPTPVTYTCLALHDKWTSSYFANGLVKVGDFMILILAATLATEPEEGDVIAIPDVGVTATIVPSVNGQQPAIETDPAHAVWICRART